MIREILKEGDISGAHLKLEEFFDFIQGIQKDHDLLSIRKNNLEESKHQGTSKEEDMKIEKNKLNLAMLNCCHEIENALPDYFPEIHFDFSSESLIDQLRLKSRGKYMDIVELFNGASAVFFEAKEVGTGRQVVLRVFKEVNYHNENPNNVEDDRVKRALNIKHRNIIKILYADLDKYPRYVALEYINGMSLDHLIGKISFSLKRTVSIIRQLCEALYHLHTNEVVHKDIKPDKVLIDNELIPVISPFDIASSLKDNPTLNVNKLLYASPELLKGNITKLDYKSDQFALGLLFYEILAGKPLFCSISQGQIERNVRGIFENRLKFFTNKKFRNECFAELGIPKRLKSIIAKMVSENPEERYNNLREVKIDLDKVKIEVEEHIEIATSSYERCNIREPNFTEYFYKILFSKSDYYQDVSKYFDSKDISEWKKIQRYKMLRIAIDSLIQCESEPEKFQQIFKLGAHAGLENYLYKSFIEAILRCIREKDPLWDHRDKVSETIHDAWDQIMEASFRIIDKYNRAI